MVKKNEKPEIKKSKNEKSEEVCEIFEVKDKEGKTKEIKTCGIVDDKPATKEQIDYQNKLLKNILIILGILIVSFIVGYFAINSMKHFEYRSVGFAVVEEIAPYRAELPVIYQGKITPYYFYLRNDPRKLDKILFNGEIVLLKNMVINTTDEINCEGDGIIALANLVNLYNVIGVKVIKDKNASCDSEGKYMFIQIKEGDKTKIEQFGPACYELYVNNCEILEVTERFMVETFVKIQEVEI